MLTRNLVLPVGQLQRLSLSFQASYIKSKTNELDPLLTARNIDRLVEGGRIRSLELDICTVSVTARANPLDYLSRFTSLTHLHTFITGTNCGSLASLLPHMPLLRALELSESQTDSSESGPPRIVVWEEVIDAVACNSPEMRHLALRARNNRRPLLESAVGSRNGLLRLDHLVSLEMVYQWEDGPMERRIRWTWLEELAGAGRLEHLVIGTYHDSELELPMKVICRVIKKCKVRLCVSRCAGFRSNRIHIIANALLLHGKASAQFRPMR